MIENRKKKFRMNYNLIKPIAIILMMSIFFSCKPSGDKMIEKMNRRIVKTEEKIEKLQNKITGYHQTIKIEEELALQTEVVDDKKSKNAKKKIAQLKKQIETLEESVVDQGDEVEVDHSGDKIVTTISPEVKDFQKFIEVQGAVTSKDIAMVASNTGGVIMSVLVTEGQYISSGQTIAVVNSDLLQSSIAEVENALVLANTVFEKQKRLWLELKVGTEIQYLQAKNNKENLEKRLETLQVQLSDATVVSTISGVVDEVFAVQGAMAGPGTPLARVVNLNRVQVEAEVPESFINKVKKGDKAEIYFASLEVTRTARIRAVSQTLNPGNRTFKIEIDLPNNDKVLKPYLLATVKLKEYENKDQLVIPTRLIQEGSKGDFVYTYSDGKVGRNWVEIGKNYEGETEIIGGLDASEQIIDLGSRYVLEGEEVVLSNNNTLTEEQ